MIVVGIDFSESAGHAVREARTLAQRLGRTVTPVHVRAGFLADAWTPTPPEARWLEAVELPPERIVVRRGTPWVELVRIAGEEGADMIVVGTHGLSGFQPVALGGTASRLALLSPRPVLLVGGRERGRGSLTTAATVAVRGG